MNRIVMMAMAGCGIVLPVSAHAATVAHAADAATAAAKTDAAPTAAHAEILPCRIAVRYLILTKWWSFHNLRR